MTSFALATFLSLFVILDPVGVSPVFLSLVGHEPRGVQKRVALRAVLTAGLILIGFGIVGRPLFEYIGVSIDALRVAGGILLFRVAFQMIVAERRRSTKKESLEAEDREDVSIFPLAIPVVAGPGAIATVMVLVSDNGSDLARQGVILGALAVALFGVFLSFRTSAGIGRVLGATGINVVSRVLGVILAAMAVQMIGDGVHGLL
jgi:multiple antibiotic resistance protein